MGVNGETPDMGGVLAALKDLPCVLLERPLGPLSPSPYPSGSSQLSGWSWPRLAVFRSVFPSLKWVEGWVKLVPTCQWQLVTACALKVRGALSGSISVWLGWVCDSFLWDLGSEC